MYTYFNPMKTLALLLTLCLLLPSPAGACPELSRRTLRAGIEGTVQAGVEEKLTTEPQYMDPKTSRALADRVDRILSGREPESDFLWPAEYNFLWSYHRGARFALKDKKRRYSLREGKYQRIEEVILAAGKRVRAYDKGVRTLETLPRLARLVLVFGADGTEGQTGKHPAVNEQTLKRFLRKHWDSKSRSILPGSRSNLRERFQRSVVFRLHFRLESQRFEEGGLEKSFDNAFDEIETITRRPRYRDLLRRLQREATESGGKRSSPLGQENGLTELLARWAVLSLEVADQLIRIAPQGAAQRLGIETRLEVQDYVQLGGEFRVIYADPTLGEMRKGIAKDKKTLQIRKRWVGSPGKKVLRYEFLLQSAEGGSIKPLLVQERIERIEKFLEEEGNNKKLFTPVYAGAEETTVEVLSEHEESKFFVELQRLLVLKAAFEREIFGRGARESQEEIHAFKERLLRERGKNEALVVARQGGRVIGYAFGERLEGDARAAEISEVITARGFRKRGVGEELLMKIFEELLKLKNPKIMRVVIYDHSKTGSIGRGAEREGFTQVGETKKYEFQIKGVKRPSAPPQAGAKEVTPEQVREWAVLLEQRLRDELDKIDRLLTDFREYFGFNWVLVRQRLPGVRAIAEQMKQLAQELEQSSAVHERTAGYELEGPLNRILIAALDSPPQEEMGTFGDRLAIATDVIRENTRQIRKVLAEMMNLQEIRLIPYHNVTLLALRSSHEIQPEWMPIKKLRKRGLQWLADQISWAAAEAEADGVALIPLAAQSDRVLNLQPLVYGSLRHRADVERYLEEANQLLREYGIRFKPMEAYNPGGTNPFGFVLFEEVPPFPERLPAIAAEYLSASNLGRLHPVFVAAKVLHPNLPWEFLKGIQVKALLVVQDDRTGARYLAVLA